MSFSHGNKATQLKRKVVMFCIWTFLTQLRNTTHIAELFSSLRPVVVTGVLEMLIRNSNTCKSSASYLLLLSLDQAN